MVPSDSGSVMWWSREGLKVSEFRSVIDDYIVHMEWSVSRNALWVCGFSNLLFLVVERNEAGETLEGFA